MDNAEEYRENAAECLKLANRPGLAEKDRRRWLELAAAWQQLAEDVEAEARPKQGNAD